MRIVNCRKKNREFGISINFNEIFLGLNTSRSALVSVIEKSKDLNFCRK